MLRAATATDVEDIVAIFEPPFRGFAILDGAWLTHLHVHPEAIGTGVGHTLFEHVKTEREPDVRYEWRPAGPRSF